MTGRRRLVLVVASLLAITVVGAGLAFWLHGYRMYVVHTGSMEPTYRPGDVVIDAAPNGDYRPGDVLTFRHSDLSTDVVTHRVTKITAAGLIETKGDANRTADVWQIRPDQVRGRTVKHVPGLGYLLVFLRQPTGIASVLTGVVGIVLLWGLFFPGESDEQTSETRARPAPGSPSRRPSPQRPVPAQ